jgi:RNA polymerase sigma-70 factor, ECF subfamily
MNHAPTPSSPDTRESLIVRLRDRGDQAAWGEFVGLYQPVIHRTARRLGLQPADAEEITQEVLAAVVRAIDRYETRSQPGSFRRWLLTIARHQTINRLVRQRGPRALGGTTAIESLAAAVDPSRDVTAEFDRHWQREVMWWAIETVRPRVDPRTMEAFWRSSIDQQPIAEVAKAMKLTPAFVHVARCRIIKRLRTLVEQYDTSTDEKVRKQAKGKDAVFPHPQDKEPRS